VPLAATKCIEQGRVSASSVPRICVIISRSPIFEGCCIGFLIEGSRCTRFNVRFACSRFPRSAVGEWRNSSPRPVP
jgi:hypothetical protein